jgi:hypothetical protein
LNTYYLILGYLGVILIATLIIYFIRRKKKNVLSMKNIKTVTDPLQELERDILSETKINPDIPISRDEEVERPSQIINIPGVEFAKYDSKLAFQDGIKAGLEGIVRSIDGLGDEIRLLKEASSINTIHPNKPKTKRIWTDEERRLAGERMRAGQKVKSEG